MLAGRAATMMMMRRSALAMPTMARATPVAMFSTEDGTDRHKLFIGGLSWGVTDDGLSNAFSRFGNVVSARVVMDRETGRSRGFGFVQFESEDAAAEALKTMDGFVLDNRTIRLNFAKIRAPSSSGQWERSSGPRRSRDQDFDN